MCPHLKLCPRLAPQCKMLEPPLAKRNVNVICLRQNARLAAGGVWTLEVARDVKVF